MNWGSEFLATKVQIPPQRHDRLVRSRLVESMEHALPRHKLILVAAPAGYGKTTLLTQWAQRSEHLIAWLALDDDDNDFERFFRYLLAAWEKVQPEVRSSPLGILLDAASPARAPVVAEFVRAGLALPRHLAFVLDDYHLITDAAVHDALTFLIDHLPPRLHFVLSGRAEPPLPLARYRARRELAEYGAADLSFLLNETAELMTDVLQLPLDHGAIVRLQTATEGWVAGLQIAALSLRNRDDWSQVPTPSGRQRHIADFLREEVLATLPDETRDFLLVTSIADRLCGSLCDALTGEHDGQTRLEALERQGLFLLPLDDRREWYRYHQLFLDLLRDELARRSPDRVADLQRRVARWYAEHDLPDQAMRHAVAGKDIDQVLALFDQHFVMLLLSGEVKTVQRWLASLPATWRANFPGILLAQAGVLMVTGQFDACAQCLDEAERCAAAMPTGTTGEIARITAMRCNVACFQNDLARAERLADEALRGLPATEAIFRPGVFAALGDTYRRNGRWEEAEACYRTLLDFSHTPAFQVEAVHVFGALADLNLRQGKLRAAAGLWQRALAAIEGRADTYPLPLTGWVYVRMGELLYEWNEVDEAATHLRRGLERAELGGDVRTMIGGTLGIARLTLGTGDLASAAGYMNRARTYVENADFPNWSSRFERLELELWLAQERRAAALDRARSIVAALHLDPHPERAIRELAAARVLIAAGDRADVAQAQEILDRVIAAAEAAGRAAIHIEALVLKALTCWRQGARAQAMTALAPAMRMAEPEGYVRLFVDYGLPMARLLQEAMERGAASDYAAHLLAAFGADTASLTAGQKLPEPLTPREQEVLELLAAGLSNREIAGKLVISSQTVKKHTGNLYAKLGVHSRAEAAARARDLKLLD